MADRLVIRERAYPLVLTAAVLLAYCTAFQGHILVR